MSSQLADLKSGAKVTFLRAQQEKIYLPGSRAVLLISVGQPVHEGAKLAATIDMVNRTFSSCDVAVCDSLQRHTIGMHEYLPKETLYINANIEGEKWIKRNDASLKAIKIPHEIFRWDKYLLDNNFNRHLEAINLAYKKSNDFASAIHKTIDEFVARHERHFTIDNKEEAINCCFNYLVEECAIIMLMWPCRKYNYIVYPGEINKALEVARCQFVAPIYSNLLKWLGVYVRTRNSHKQKFLVLQEEEFA